MKNNTVKEILARRLSAELINMEAHREDREYTLERGCKLYELYCDASRNGLIDWDDVEEAMDTVKAAGFGPF